MKIRLSQTDSINSINEKNIVGIELKSTSKKLPFLDAVGEVNAYDVFVNERNNCNNYRLILTINPYCTNILFNTLTEVVKDEGSKDVKTVRDKTEKGDDNSDIVETTDKITNAYGIQTPTRVQMIANTEYSRNDVGYKYLPGFDIFNNHIMRNKTFKVVNKIELKPNENDDIRKCFNTISDYLRYMDGSTAKTGKRLNIDSEPSRIEKHLYLYDDIMSLEESINTNLSEENGWVGFINKNNVPSKDKRNGTVTDISGHTIYDELGISKILNNYENCEFIDMYPDRTLFSFNPKVNSFRKRLEYNWDIILTFPYRNEYCHELITDTNRNINGLKMMSATKTINANGNVILLFRSYIKHNIKRGDYVRIYTYNDEQTIINDIKVTNVGNLSSDNNGNEMYYFYTTDISLFNDLGFIYNTDNGKWETTDENDINDVLNRYNYRIKRIVNNVESEYYIRVFRKIPNLKNKKENLTDEIVKDKTAFEDYIYGDKMNASVIDDNNKKKMIDFNKEQYKLAFSRTIYNDASAQVTFTDTINVDHLIDNLGRPLHEFYVTLIKTNRGYKEWYGITTGYTSGKKDKTYTFNEEAIKLESDNVEFSHCFGNLSSGVVFFHEENDKYDTKITDCANLGDIGILNELDIYSPNPMETEITSIGSINPNNNTSNIDEFYGDIVEYVPCECNEYVLQPICHRFNTAQRELPKDGVTITLFNNFNHDEIKTDDLDYDDFHVDNVNEAKNFDIKYDNVTANNNKGYCNIQRPEGYFYQAHYPIAIKEIGDIHQNMHEVIRVREAKPVQKNGIFIEITTRRNYGVVAGDIIYICIDDDTNYRNDNWFEFTVAYTEGKNKFCICPYNMTWQDMKNEIKNKVKAEYNWITLSQVLTEPTNNEDYTQLILRKKNTNIPDYATKIAHNTFLWRDINRPGETTDSSLEQYPFANNAFYINKEINFFLKRQDPHDYTGLYCSQAFPNDIEGNYKKEDNYVYKTEDEIVC